MNQFNVFMQFVLVLALIGCVEVRDRDDENGPTLVVQPMVPVQELGSLIVDGTMFIYDGQILSEKDLELEMLRQNIRGDSPMASQDLEFHFNEVVFKENAVLYSLGNRVRLHAERLESKKGVITTFPDSVKAAMGQSGRSGGHLYLHIGKAQGSLEIRMAGEPGGEGKAGAVPDSRLWGRNGKNGQHVFCSDVVFGTEFNGAAGEAGLQGYPGFAGADGGRSGTLELHVLDETEFTIRYSKKGGAGGAGGAGGRGGVGGKGGAMGSVTSREGDGRQCSRPKKGEDGREGAQGLPGISGKVGAEEQICITRRQTTTCL